MVLWSLDGSRSRNARGRNTGTIVPVQNSSSTSEHRGGTKLRWIISLTIPRIQIQETKLFMTPNPSLSIMNQKVGTPLEAPGPWNAREFLKRRKMTREAVSYT